MINKTLSATLAVMALMLSNSAFAADLNDVTIDVMNENATMPDAVSQTIELPADANEEGILNSATGLSIANGARDLHNQAVEDIQDFHNQVQDQITIPEIDGVPSDLPGQP